VQGKTEGRKRGGRGSGRASRMQLCQAYHTVRSRKSRQSQRVTHNVKFKHKGVTDRRQGT
jgi:hypothetical protein